jgi:hypothetical protein
MTHDNKLNVTSTLIAALKLVTGKVIGECKKQHRHQVFLGFIKNVNEQPRPEEKEFHIIVDYFSTHKHKKAKY